VGEVPLGFDAVYDEFRPKVLRYLARLVGESEAEDLAQEVFVKVHGSLSGFRGESSLSTWIYKIATNTALDRLKSPAFKRETPAVQDESGAGGGPEVLTDDAAPVDQRLIREQMNECIRGVVDTLPPDYRTVIALSEMQELKDRDIADVLGVSVGAVKIRLHRARAVLKKELQDHCNFYRDGRNEFACEPKTAPITFKKR